MVQCTCTMKETVYIQTKGHSVSPVLFFASEHVCACARVHAHAHVCERQYVSAGELGSYRPGCT